MRCHPPFCIVTLVLLCVLCGCVAPQPVATVSTLPPLPPVTFTSFARDVIVAPLPSVVIQPPPNYSTNISLAWQSFNPVALYIGDATGKYNTRIDEGTNQTDTLTLVSTNHYFFTLVEYSDYNTPQVVVTMNLYTNHGIAFSVTNTVTNFYLESLPTPEVFAMFPQTPPFVMISNGVPNYYICGDSASNYIVQASYDLTNWFPWQSFAGEDAPTNFPMSGNQMFARWNAQ